jgi:hypothetical protein
MQSVIAASAPAECVGLYCAQLLHLGADAHVPNEEVPGRSRAVC